MFPGGALIWRQDLYPNHDQELFYWNTFRDAQLVLNKSMCLQYLRIPIQKLVQRLIPTWLTTFRCRYKRSCQPERAIWLKPILVPLFREFFWAAEVREVERRRVCSSIRWGERFRCCACQSNGCGKFRASPMVLLQICVVWNERNTYFWDCVLETTKRELKSVDLLHEHLFPFYIFWNYLFAFKWRQKMVTCPEILFLVRFEDQYYCCGIL